MSAPSTSTAGPTMAQMIGIRGWIRDVTAGSALTDAELQALLRLLDEILLGVDTVARVQRDDPDCTKAAQAIVWRRVATVFTDLLIARTIP